MSGLRNKSGQFISGSNSETGISGINSDFDQASNTDILPSPSNQLRNEQILSLLASIETLNRKISAQGKLVNDHKNSIKEQRKELEGQRAQSHKIIETLAVFTSLFTFISFEVQIFKSPLSPYTLIGLTLIILGALAVFIIALEWVLGGTDIEGIRKTRLRNVAIATVICVSGGVVLACWGYSLYDFDKWDKTFIDKDTYKSDVIRIEKNIDSIKEEINILRIEERNLNDKIRTLQSRETMWGLTGGLNLDRAI